MNELRWGAFGWNVAVSAGVVLAVVLTAFLIGVRTGKHRGVDVAWGLGFAAVAVATYGVSAGEGDAARRLLVTVLTAVWGVRLAVHIGRRSRGHGEDPRYEQLLAKAPGNRQWYALRMVYLLQGALIVLVSLPVQIAAYATRPLSLPLSFFAVAGAVVWAVGLFFEAVGDRQLARFKTDPAHRGRLMDRGLWSWTRHPNYFGDFCVWWGLFLIACEAGPLPALLALVSPLAMSYLLIGGSGKALLERHMAERPGYAAYAARTSGFFPRPPRRG
ncbi:DUF1295 domain-containing protein [Streptomyces sp. NBC_00006]|uniref:DUF1295 domain-containing protein n=1 Tax=Streptomyces sp. NBC_00006 TaxID=2975619 RepID=UPI002257A8C5|nr:DUF1295 domain-containing protein [Streptomyces sp. NBC_00006]MCX5535364.1 DUF1295 domain-containing protein [Streptomyces sp. NBC_00006]